MKKNDLQALKEKTLPQLNKQLAELEAHLAKSRLEKKAMKLNNLSLIRVLTDDIARVKTELTSRRMAESQAESQIK